MKTTPCYRVVRRRASDATWGQVLLGLLAVFVVLVGLRLMLASARAPDPKPVIVILDCE